MVKSVEQRARLEIYITDDEKLAIIHGARKCHVSVSAFLIECTQEVMSSSKKMGHVARNLRVATEGRNARRYERETGDYLGAEDKLKEKLRRIEYSGKPERIKKLLRLDARKNYATTDKEHLKKLIRRTMGCRVRNANV
jgi:hypothetical protein